MLKTKKLGIVNITKTFYWWLKVANLVASCEYYYSVILKGKNCVVKRMFSDDMNSQFEFVFSETLVILDTLKLWFSGCLVPAEFL